MSFFDFTNLWRYENILILSFSLFFVIISAGFSTIANCLTFPSTEVRKRFYNGEDCSDKVDSPYELVERSEYRATRWTTETYLTKEAFRAAFAEGYTELWQLSEYFDLPEDCISAALTYWKERKGIDFEI